MSSKTKSAQDWEWEADFSVPDEVTWNRMVVNDLCGGKCVPDKANGTAILNELLLDLYRCLNTQGLVKYLVNRCLLTEGETWALTQKPLDPQEKTLQLQQILMKKGENPLIVFYQCLLESYGLEQGLAAHYTLVQIIKRKVRFHDCSDMVELLQLEKSDKEPAEVVRRIKAVPIPSETARRLIEKLHLEECNMNIDEVTTQDIAKCWLATDKAKDWTVLVEALLTERGCGCSVSGVLPLSVSNPPEVWHFVQKLNKEWPNFADFLGFPRRLITDIKSAWMRDTGTQIKSFMRVCLIPDCGDEKIRAIIQQVIHNMPVSQRPSISPKDLIRLSQINPSEDEKEDLPGVRAVNSWSAQGGVVVFQIGDFLKVIEQQKHTEAAPWGVYRGGATPSTGIRSNLCADDETTFLGGNSAEYCSAYDTSNATMSSQEEARESDVKSQGMKTSEPTRQQSLCVSSATEDNSGRDILQACVQDVWEFVKQSVTSASNLEVKNKNGRTALHICCIKGNTEVVKLLLQHGADVTTVDNEGNSCLHFQETLKNEVLVEVVVKEFQKKNIPLDQLNKNDLTPLMVACLTNSDLCTKAIIHLITNGATIDGPPELYSTPLIHASAGGNKRIVEILILYGANVNKQDQEGSTALIQSCLCNHTDIAIILLEAEADVNRAEKSGTAALAAAITRNSYELVQRLLEKGANPNAIRVITNDFASGQVEETPLAFACAHGLRDIAQLLIIHGAKVNFMCSDQVPAIGFAIIGWQQETVEFMLQVEEFNKSVYGLAIPMHIAMNVENLEAAKAVLDVLGGPQKALELALQKNHHQFVQDISLFIEVGGDTQVISREQPATRSFASESRNQRVKVEQTLQTFSQICMSAITANGDHEVIIDLATIDDVPHVAVFFRDYFNKPHRADILKANFLNRDNGISPLNFSIEHSILNSVDFQVHAFEFFPEGPDQFYTDLVWAFHQIAGGEDLSWDVTSVLQRLFCGSFSLNVQTSMADGHMQAQQNFPETNHTPRPVSNSSRATAVSSIEPCVSASTTTSQPSTLSNSTADQKKHLDAVEEVMKKEGELNQTIVQCVFIGPPRNGKTSLMRRLVGQKPIGLHTLPSTGVAEKVLQVKIERTTVQIDNSLPNASSFVWSELSFDSEVLRLLENLKSENCTSQQLSGDACVADMQTESVRDKKVTNVENYTADEHTLTSQKPTTNKQHCSPIEEVQIPIQDSLLSSNFKSPREVFKEALRNKGWLGAKEYMEGACIAYLTDTGGQLEFQELLSALVSGPSIFFLVFRLDQDLSGLITIEYVRSTDSTSKPYQSSFTLKEFLLQSLASIASMGTFNYKKGLSRELQPLRPKVFFIGTHKDLVSQKRIQEVDSELQKVVRATEHYTEGLVQFASESRILLAVNNLSPNDCEFDCVRVAVQRIISRGNFNVTAPPQWLIFSLVIRQMQDQRVVTYDECFKIARQCGMNSKEELNEALWFLSTTVGLIRHFQGKDLEDLHEIVILDPQVLFDKITDLIVATFTFENTDPVFYEDFQKKGIFTMNVLETISGRSKDSLLTASKLVQVLQHLHIIAQINKEGEAAKFFMPCILSHADSVKFRTDKKHQIPPLLVAFDCGYCPKGLFAALVTYLLNKIESKYEWELNQEEIFKNQISFMVGPYADTVSLTFSLTFIEIFFAPNFSVSTRKLNFDVCCTEVRKCFEKSLQTVTVDLHYMQDAKYFLGFYCPEYHPAKIRFLDGQPCSLICNSCSCTSDLPCGMCNVWFGQQPRPQRPCPQQKHLQQSHPQQLHPQQPFLSLQQLQQNQDEIVIKQLPLTPQYRDTSGITLVPTDVDSSMTVDTERIPQAMPETSIDADIPALPLPKWIDTAPSLLSPSGSSVDTTFTGSQEDILGDDDLFDIKCYLLDLEKTHIYNLGLALGLSQRKVKAMKDSDTFLDDMLAAWLRREDNVIKKGVPSWRTLVRALKHKLLCQNGVASDICRDKRIQDA